MSRLYSEEPVLPEVEATGLLIHDPERRELRQVLDTFLTATHMEELRRSFYVALGTLNDAEARSVKRFLIEVLRDKTDRTKVRLRHSNVGLDYLGKNRSSLPSAS